MAPLRRPWNDVKAGDSFNDFIVDADDRLVRCLENVINELRGGRVDLVPAGLANYYYIFACEVIVTVIVRGNRATLSVVVEEAHE